MGNVRVKSLKMSSHFNGDMRMIVLLMMLSFSVNQCIATEENILPSRAWFRHLSLSFVKLINNNLVKLFLLKIRYIFITFYILLLIYIHALYDIN